MKRTLLALALAAILALPDRAIAASGDGKMTMPDFTKGETIPAGAKHDWNLGARFRR